MTTDPAYWSGVLNTRSPKFSVLDINPWLTITLVTYSFFISKTLLEKMPYFAYILWLVMKDSVALTLRKAMMKKIAPNPYNQMVW